MNKTAHSGKYWIETYGCQMNKAESESITLQLESMGLSAADDAGMADVVILNTCSVRKTAEDRIWGRIGYYRSRKSVNKKLKIVVIGCMAERLKEELLSGKEKVDIVVGNFEKHRLAPLLKETLGHRDEKPYLLAGEEEYRFFSLHNSSSFKAFLPIMHGCNNFCSYCIVPYVRGREVSRSPESILKEITQMEKIGVKEITLLGQNVNSYHFEENGKTLRFPELLELIAAKVKTVKWIRFMTSHPKDLSDELIRVIKENPVFCRHIHLPVQHGSDRILNLMRRRYTRDSYLTLVDKIRSAIPGISITTDILIGFPTEEEQDYEDTLALMERVQFNNAYMYKYNPREGTEAFKMEDTVLEETKLARLGEIIRRQLETSTRLREKRIGECVDILVESVSKKNNKEMLGRTECDDMVVFPGIEDQIGQFIRIKLAGLNGSTFWGEEV